MICWRVLSGIILISSVDNARFGEAKTSLVLISLVLDQETSDALQLMICDYPRYPVDGQTRFIESMDDITNINNFLGSPADYTKI